MLILVYIMLSGIKMRSLTDFGAPRILTTMESWAIILPAPRLAEQRLPASVVSSPIEAARASACTPSYEKTKERACGVRGSDEEAKVCVSNPDRNQKAAILGRLLEVFKPFLKLSGVISPRLFQREPSTDFDSRSTFLQSALIRRLLCSTAAAARGYFGLQTFWCVAPHHSRPPWMKRAPLMEMN